MKAMYNFKKIASKLRGLFLIMILLASIFNEARAIGLEVSVTSPIAVCANANFSIAGTATATIGGEISYYLQLQGPSPSLNIIGSIEPMPIVWVGAGLKEFDISTAVFSPITQGGTYTLTVRTIGAPAETGFTSIIIDLVPIPTVDLTSAVGTDAQRKCITSATIDPITYAVSGTTTTTVSGLPTGVTGSYSAGIFTISGTPVAAGVSTYVVTTVSGVNCSTSKSGTITVDAVPTVTLSSAVGTDAQRKCINTAITNITYAVSGTTSTTVSGLPAGVSGSLSAGTFTISGTPTTTVGSPFTYTVTNVNGACSATATGTITVDAVPTVTLTSGNNLQSICIINPIANITYTVSGTTTTTVTNLPAGITGSLSGTTFTISGTPTASGTYFYTVTNVNGACSATASGTISVDPVPTINLTSANNVQTICVGAAIGNILYTVSGTSTTTVSGLPAGVTGSLSAGTFTISGTPTTAVGSPFNYTVTNVNGACSATATGTITVNALQSITPASATGTVCQNAALSPSIVYTIGGSATGASITGGTLPSGLVGTFTGTTFTISGTVSGTATPTTYNFTVTTSGANCTPVSATGSITVNQSPIVTWDATSGTQTPTTCVNGAIIPIVYNIGGAWSTITITGLPAGMTGMYNNFTYKYTISGSPSAVGTFNYTLTADNDLCGGATGVGTITVVAIPTAPVAGDFIQPTCTVPTGSVTLSGLPSTGIWTVTLAPGGTTTGTGTTLTLSGLASGNYSATVANSAGCISSPVTFAISAAPVVPTAPVVGTIVQPTCSLATGSVTLTGLPATGSWTVNIAGVAPVTGTGTSTTIVGLAAGTYTATVTNSATCTSVASANIVINTQPGTPTITGTTPGSRCGAGTVTLSATASAGTVNWYTSATATSTVFVGGTYTTGTLSATTTYYVDATSGSCTTATRTTVTATVNPVPTATISGTATVCQNATALITFTGIGGTAPYTFTYDVNAGTATTVTTVTGNSVTVSASTGTAGTYIYSLLSVQDANICSSTQTGTATVTVNAISTLALTSGSNNQSLCIGGAIGTIVYTYGGATTAVTSSGLPTGLSTNTNLGLKTFTITGTPTQSGTFNYTITAASALCGSATATGTITVGAIATAPVVGTITQPTCAVSTGSVALSGLPATGMWTLVFSPSTGGTYTGTGTTTTISGLAAGTYTATVATYIGCTSPASASMVINAAPAVPTVPVVGTIVNPTCIVATGSVTLTGLPSTGTWTVTLNPGALTTSGTGTSTTIAGLASGTYTATVTNAAVCTSAVSANIVISAVPTQVPPTVGAITQPTCTVATGSVALSNLPAGTWTVTINPGALVTSGTTTSTVISNLPAGATYTAVVTNSGGCTSVPSADIVINAQPVATAPVIGAITQPTCTVATGTVALSGLPATGTWTLTFSPASGGTYTGTGTTKTVTGLAAGTYTATVTNASGCTSPASANIVINAQPTAPSAPVVGTITQPTCSVATGSVALSGLPATGVWTVIFYPTGGTFTGTGTTTTKSGLVAGTYTATVTNADGCTSVASASIVINAQPATPTAPTVGAIAQPTCTLATGSVVLNGLPAAGTWTVTINPGAIVKTGTGVTTTVTGLVANTYTAVVTNAAGCTSVASANIVINAQPSTPTAPVVGTITQPTCSVATGSVVLNGLPATGTWTINPGAITGTGVSTTIAGLVPGTYNYTVTNAAGCTSPASDNIVINVQPATPVATASNNGPMCAGLTLNLIGGPAGMTSYAWSGPNGFTSTVQNPTIANVTAAAAGVYSLVVTNAAGCSSVAATTTVVINATPVATAANNGPMCEGGTLNLYGQPAGASSYLWVGPNGYTSNVQNPVITNVTAAATGQYVLLVTNSNGCQGVAVTSVTIYAKPATTATNNGPLCSGSTLNLVGGPDGMVSYAWTGPNGYTSNVQNPTIANATVANAGVYTLLTTNDNGCSASANTTVEVNPIPETPVVTQNGMVLTSSVSAGNQWYYNGTAIPGATDQTYTVTHNTGWYWVMVTLNGCSSPISNKVWVEVVGVPEMPASASFSIYPVPNNGEFTASIRYPVDDTFTIVVYNQLGEQLYELRNAVTTGGKLDTQIDLRPIPSGTYTVVFRNSTYKVVKRMIVFNK